MEWEDKHFLPEMEEKWEQEWEKRKTYRFDPKAKGEWYSIDTPPPFTSGELHMGHVLSYSFFDFAARFRRMKGFNVYYPQGWDTQGFPTEVKVEQKYGKSEPKEFLEHCKEWTDQCIATMKKQMTRMGFSPDWDHEYRTMDPGYHRLVQISLLRQYREGTVYRGEHPVYYCWKCNSALAKTDTDDTEESTVLNHLVFLAKDSAGKEEKITVATTRPELLHACVAVLFHPEDPRYNDGAIKRITTPLGKEVPFIADRDVDKEFGSGVVMVCTFGDKQDIIWWRRHKLDYVEAFDDKGIIINSGAYDGTHIKKARAAVLEIIKQKGLWIKEEQISHAVKVHDRCKTHVEFKISSQWFAKVMGFEDEIISTARKMKWFPDFTIAHLVDWATNLEWDWVISRQRTFGTPIPFWHCRKCKKIIAPEEKELPVDPRIHERKCKDCGEVLEGERSVCDCWVDSSITPLAIAKWEQGNQEFFSKAYPSTLRPQGVEIIRTWAFYTTYRCMLLTGKPCFKELLINGNVLAPDGRKMSKSLGNVIQPDELVKKYTADAVRQWAAMSGAMAKDRPFSFEDINFAKKFINKLWNASKYVHMQTGGKFVHREALDAGKKIVASNPMDLWILSKFGQLVEEVNQDYMNYEYHKAIKKIQEFFWYEFCDYYLEATKSRAYDQKDQTAIWIYSLVMENTLRMLAPIACHVTEEIYSKFREVDSIHRLAFPSHEWFTGAVELKGELPEGFEDKLKEAVQAVWKAKKEKEVAKIVGLKLKLPMALKGMDLEFKSIFRPEELEVSYEEIEGALVEEIR